jgi:hypothetical protein
VNEGNLYVKLRVKEAKEKRGLLSGRGVKEESPDKVFKGR